MVLERMGAEPFSTYDFTVEYEALFPEEWADLKTRYGKGGRGAGQYHTVNTYVAQRLGVLARQDAITQLDYRPAPDGYGNRIIRYWSSNSPSPEGGTRAIATDHAPAIDEEFREGSVTLRTHLRRERHWRLASAKREAFIKEHGKLSCERCQLDPETTYGLPFGNSVIEVHHAATAVGHMTPNTKVKLADLQCLCANCHRIVHAEIRSA